MPDFEPSEQSARQRKPAEKAPSSGSAAEPNPEPVPEAKEEQPKEAEKKVKPVKARIEEEEKYSPWVDVLRVVAFLFLASCGLSYLISGGETWFWGIKNPPNYMRVSWWKTKLTPPLYLTLEELAAYDGSNTSKPLYLAINGTIYDVSANRRTYGPGGSYHWFAGCDAARAYVTGCFSEDRTADVRGVEAMFLPVDDPEVDAYWTAEELAALKVEERKKAEQETYEHLKHWVDFFANSKKYHKVGYVKRPKGWPENEPLKPLCAPAQNGRKKREIPQKEEE